MINIQRALDATNTFDGLYAIAKDAKPKLTSWGAKSILVQGYQGSLPIDALTKKALELVLQNPGYPIDHNNHLDARTRLRDSIELVYVKSDEQVRAANCFTWLLTLIRSFRFCGPNHSPLRGIWMESACKKSGSPSLSEAITRQHLTDIGELRLYLEDRPDYSFWRQLREDFYWNVTVLFCPP